MAGMCRAPAPSARCTVSAGTRKSPANNNRLEIAMVADSIQTRTPAEEIVKITAPPQAMTTTAELAEEAILCARHGETEDLALLLSTHPGLASTKTADSLNTPLHYSAANGHVETTRQLVSVLSPNLITVQNAAGNTPLHWAALNGHIAVVELLLENGADAMICNGVGHDALFEAQQSGKEAVVEAILKMLPEDEVDEDAEGVSREDEEEISAGENTPEAAER